MTERRTAVDFAQQMKWLVDTVYPNTELIRVVLDPLNTHSLGSLYEAFAPEEARRIARRLEVHYTPKHARGLNMAEIDFSVLERQCLDRRLGSPKEVRRETGAWAEARDRAGATVHWRFNLEKARTKMHRFYPSQLP